MALEKLPTLVDVNIFIKADNLEALGFVTYFLIATKEHGYVGVQIFLH